MSDAAITLLDGATGTELSRRGQDTRLPLWSARPLADAPEAVVAVHRDYLGAGCDVLTACTFRTHERSLQRGRWAGRSAELNRRAVDCAREAVEAERAEGIRVAGSIAPLEDCFAPSLVPSDGELEREHGEQAESLAAAGADLLLVETMNTRREAEAAVTAARAAGLPTWCSFVTDGAGHLLSGEPLADAARAVEDLGVEAALVNCLPVVDLLGDVGRLLAAVEVPAGGYGNIGHAHDVEGWRVELMLSPTEFAARSLECVAAGARIVGGCCGTQPEHLAELAERLRNRPG